MKKKENNKNSKQKYSNKEYSAKQIVDAIRFAGRLKRLRNKHNLSHETLSEKLFENCGISISVKTLKNYEVIDVNHSNFGATLGAGMKNILALAEFFDVSVDYLLGRAECTNLTYEQIYKTMGLSEEAINRLMAIKNDTNTYHSEDKFTVIDVINLILTDKEYKFSRLLRHLLEYFKLAKFKKEVNLQNKERIKKNFDRYEQYSKPDECILLNYYLKTDGVDIAPRKLSKLKKEKEEKLSKLDEKTQKNNRSLLELYKVIVAGKNDKLNEKLDFNLFYAQSYLKEIVQDVDIETLNIERTEELQNKIDKILKND